MSVAKVPVEELPAHLTAWVQRSTLLGSPGFARLWDTVGGRAVFWTVSERDRIIALLPGVEFGRGVLTRYQAMPDGLYARVLFPEGSPDPDEAVRQLLGAVARAGYLRAFVNDYFSHAPETERFRVRTADTLLVDIASLDWLPPDKKLVSEIRKAGREGVQLQEFSLNRHFDRFLELMQQTEHRHARRPKYPPSFFRALGKLAMIDNRVRWVVCEHEGQLTASHIYLIEGEMVLNWQVYFDKSFSFLKPNQFITFTVAREMPRRQVTTLNLGATPGSADTLADYKRKWGGKPRQYQCLYCFTWLGRIV